MLPRHGFAWLFLALLSTAGVIRPCSAQQQQFGVAVHNNLATQVPTAVLGNNLSIRTDVQWRWVETSPGSYTFDFYKQMDDYLTRAVQQGARPIVVLCTSPKFYDGGGLPISATAVQAYLGYVKYVVDHFKGRVDRFEVWNEWNLNEADQSQPHVWGQASDYVNLLKAASAVIKAENSDATVIAGVVGGTDGNWIDKFIQAGGLAYADGLSVHPYVQRHAHGHADSREFIWSAPNGTIALPYLPGSAEESIAWLDLLKLHLNAVSAKPMPVFVSEIGWPTSTDEFGVSENVAATALQRFLLLARTRPWIAGVWWYDLIDDGAAATNEEDRFGLLRQSGAAKPAFDSLLKIKDTLQSTSTFSQSITAAGQIQILSSTGKVVATWSPLDSQPVAQPAAPLLMPIK